MVAADDRVELAFLGGGWSGRGRRHRGPASCFLLRPSCLPRAFSSPECGRRCHFAGVGGAEQVEDLLAHVLELQAEVDQHLGGDALVLAQQAEQDVLGADVGMAEGARFFAGEFEHLLGLRGEGQLAHVGAILLVADHELLDLVAHLVDVDVEVVEGGDGNARALLHQAEQDVLGADVVVQQRFDADC